METGTRRECLFYLADSHWLIFRRWVAGFTVILLLTLFATTSPVQAAGQVNPTIKNTGFWFPEGWALYDISNAYGSANEACEGVRRAEHAFHPWWNNVFVGTAPNVDYYASREMLNCLFQNPDTGVIAPFGSVEPVRRSVCPSSSKLFGGLCTCDADYKPDATITICVPVATCPIPKFPDINDSDACTKSLEAGAGKFVEGECKPLDPEMVKQEQCLAKKIRALGISYTEPSSTVRTVAYQQHFVDLWEWYKVKIPAAQKKWSDAEKQECAPMVAKVNAEWEKHVLVGRPSESGLDAPHVLRKAVDIDRSIPKLMMKAVNKTIFLVPFPMLHCWFCPPEYPVYIGDVQDYVNSPLVNPPACKLRWGGRFINNYDPVHFDLLLK